ncbi:MAG: N-acetylmuramoyl-L-alanine amidase [Bacillota bacterium]|nr:N-acetylmuramoyl-L-alanine amidase [Bacillota bacterium]
MARIVLDPGHGGKDPGAVGPTGLREADVAYGVCEKLAALLEGHEVHLTRGTRDGPSLAERVDLSNRLKAGVFVSVHLNAAANPAAEGIETFYHAQSPRGLRLATRLYDALRAEFPQARGRGAKSDLTRYQTGLYVLRNTIAPAALVELEFISHPAREAEMRDPGWAERAARALAAGIREYIEETTPPRPPKPWDHPIDFRAGGGAA